MSPRLTALVLSLLTAGGAAAQTYDPAQTQRMLNQQQLDIQSQQLQQLQLQTNQGLQRADPAAAMQAAQAQLRINQQTADLQAARMQALSADPADIDARLQQSGAAIQQIRPPPPAQ